MAFLNEVLGLFVIVLRIYFYMLFASIVLSWTSIRSTGFYEALSKTTDPYLNLFRGKLIAGGWDFGPIIGMLLLEFLIYFIDSVAI